MHNTDSVPLSLVLDAIEWDQPNADGTMSSTVVGRREPGVMFTYAFFIPAGVFDAPHSHAANAHVIVASGTLRLGYGTRFDSDLLGEYPVGSFLFVPADVVHFDGADVDTIIIGTATGPWDTTYA